MYKVRFVAKGYAQKEGIDYEETFTPVSRYTSIRSVISLAALDRMENSPDGHQDNILEEGDKGRGLGLVDDCKRNLATEFDMKNLGLMHYFLGLEVWQKDGEIFLGQGRYATDILKRFKMQVCRPMSTPMITNWKKIDASDDMDVNPKIDASDDKDVNPTLYRHLIRFLMYLVNTRPNICFIVNTQSIHGRVEEGTLGSSEAYFEVCVRHNQVWVEIYLRR
eukprot:PITA_17799